MHIQAAHTLTLHCCDIIVILCCCTWCILTLLYKFPGFLHCSHRKYTLNTYFDTASISVFPCSLFPPHLSTPLPVSPSLIPLQLFKEELTQVKEGMKHINDLAHQLAISDVHLSMENARALEHLNSRWKVLQVEFTAGSMLSV